MESKNKNPKIRSISIDFFKQDNILSSPMVIQIIEELKNLVDGGTEIHITYEGQIVQTITKSDIDENQ